MESNFLLNMKYALGILLAGVTMLQSCLPQNGCTDPEATNFNANAEMENGSCTYQADNYTGNFIANDTLIYIINNTVYTQASTTSFIIAKKDKNQVYLIGLGSCTDTLVANTSDKSMVIANASSCGFGTISIYKQNNQLRYSFETYIAPGPSRLGTISGIATEQ